MNNDDFQTLDTDITSLETEMVAVKKSVSDGKTLVAAAVTRKDVQTAATDSFATIASNIDSITTVEQATADATALASDILINKTAYAQGAKLIGTMANNGLPATAITNGVLKAGYTPGGAIANLVESNIKSGVNICGVVGVIGRENSGTSYCQRVSNSWCFDITMPYEIKRARATGFVGNENIEGIMVTIDGTNYSNGYYISFYYPNQSNKKVVRCYVSAGGDMSTSKPISWRVGD